MVTEKEVTTKHLEFKWSVSRGRDTYGYNICTLWVNGMRTSACNGGGYDMNGTSLGNFIARHYKDRLLKLKESDMPENSHWQADFKAYICRKCATDRVIKGLPVHEAHTETETPETFPQCPDCKIDMERNNRAGKRVSTGRGFYGLTFHDPNYDPSKAVIGTDCNDRTLTKNDEGSEGLTVKEAEEKGVSFGLERYQAVYKASSKFPTDRHTIPSIDGGCGFRCVEDIMKAIGLTLRYLPGRSKSNEAYILEETI